MSTQPRPAPLAGLYEELHSVLISAACTHRAIAAQLGRHDLTRQRHLRDATSLEMDAHTYAMASAPARGGAA